ncbi:uncharacterized protein DS421_11g325040 [Arachis hypogaea]|nr:uncharacterized protein DS421_11g325040 [Arachis hypogaea]
MNNKDRYKRYTNSYNLFSNYRPQLNTTYNNFKKYQFYSKILIHCISSSTSTIN